MKIPDCCLICGGKGQIYEGDSGWWCNWCGGGWTHKEELKRDGKIWFDPDFSSTKNRKDKI